MSVNEPRFCAGWYWVLGCAEKRTPNLSTGALVGRTPLIMRSVPEADAVEASRSQEAACAAPSVQYLHVQCHVSSVEGRVVGRWRIPREAVT